MASTSSRFTIGSGFFIMILRRVVCAEVFESLFVVVVLVFFFLLLFFLFFGVTSFSASMKSNMATKKVLTPRLEIPKRKKVVDYRQQTKHHNTNLPIRICGNRWLYFRNTSPVFWNTWPSWAKSSFASCKKSARLCLHTLLSNVWKWQEVCVMRCWHTLAVHEYKQEQRRTHCRNIHGLSSDPTFPSQIRHRGMF